MCVWGIGVGTSVPQCICGGKRKSNSSQFFPSTMWIPGMELRLLALTDIKSLYPLSHLPNPSIHS